jgi:hypothetical protein
MDSGLEQILDECIDRMKQGEPVEDILRAHAAHADELRPLLSIVRGLEELTDPAPAGEDILRSFVKASAEMQRQKPAGVRFFSRPFLLRAAAVLLAVFLVGWATTTASADAVPGDWLYPVKRFTERARFFLTVNSEDKAELRIVFSSERLKEAVQQYQRAGVLDQGLLDEMLEEARLAADASADLEGTSRSLVAAQAAHASEYQQQVLDGMKGGASSEHTETFSRYANMCGRRAQWMQGMSQWRNPGPRSASPQQEQDDRGNRRWRDRCPWW